MSIEISERSFELAIESALLPIVKLLPLPAECWIRYRRPAPETRASATSLRTGDPREPLLSYARCLAHFAVDPDLEPIDDRHEHGIQLVLRRLGIDQRA
jgi:hypothetical protein